MSGLGNRAGGALVLNLAHESTDVLAGVPGQLDDLALPHALPYGIAHGDGQGGTGVPVSNLFRYACGIGWRYVTELQERARAILAAPADE